MGQRHFSGDPKATWLTEPGPDRDMELTEDFWFIDELEREWDAPEGSVINGASIPRQLWSLIGSPYTGDYRRASIVHDVACDLAGKDRGKRRAADRMFFEACRAGGCSKWDASVLYVGVRIGAWWGQMTSLAPPAVRLAPDESDAQVQADFQTVSEEVLRQGETDDPAEVERRTDEAIARRAALRASLGLAAPPLDFDTIDGA